MSPALPRDVKIGQLRRSVGLLPPDDWRNLNEDERAAVAAAAAIAFLEQSGLMIDTGRTKKPRRSADSLARAERFQKRGEIAQEGGKEAQPTRLRSYSWRVFRVPALVRLGQRTG